MATITFILGLVCIGIHFGSIASRETNTTAFKSTSTQPTTDLGAESSESSKKLFGPEAPANSTQFQATTGTAETETDPGLKTSRGPAGKINCSEIETASVISQSTTVETVEPVPVKRTTTTETAETFPDELLQPPETEPVPELPPEPEVEESTLPQSTTPKPAKYSTHRLSYDDLLRLQIYGNGHEPMNLDSSEGSAGQTSSVVGVLRSILVVGLIVIVAMALVRNRKKIIGYVIEGRPVYHSQQLGRRVRAIVNPQSSSYRRLEEGA